MAPTVTVFKLSTYLILMSLSFSLCVWWAYLRSKKLKLAKTVLDLTLVLIISGIIGGRVFHVLIENPTFYFNNPLDVLKLHQGGFVFYGGFLFAFVFGFIFLKLKNQKITDYLDLLAPVIPFGYGLGRIGCFFSGCCFGKETDFFLKLFDNNITSHPTQLCSAIISFMIMTVVLYLEKNRYFEKRRFHIYLILYGIFRIWIENLRGDFRGEYHFSTIVSILIILITTYFIVFKKDSFGQYLTKVKE